MELTTELFVSVTVGLFVYVVSFTGGTICFAIALVSFILFIIATIKDDSLVALMCAVMIGLEAFSIVSGMEYNDHQARVEQVHIHAQHVLEQFSSYDEIETGALTGDKIDVFTKENRKDVCITSANGESQFYFHVYPDLSYEEYTLDE